MLILEAGDGALRWSVFDRPEAGEQQMTLTNALADRLVAVLGVTPDDAEPLARAAGVSGNVVLIDEERLAGVEFSATALDLCDAIVLSEQEYRRLTQRASFVRDLLAAGVSVAVSSTAPPDGLPWRAVEGGHVLIAPSIGPDAVARPDSAYAPVNGWKPTRPDWHRWVVIGLAGVAFLAIVPALLLKRKNTLRTVLPLAFAMIVAALMFQFYREPTAATAGKVIAVEQDWITSDTWTYSAVMVDRSAETGVEWRQFTRPVFISTSHLSLMSPALLCRADGSIAAIQWTQPPETQMALLSRSVSDRSATLALGAPEEAEANRLVRDLYLSKTVRVRKVIASPGARFNSYVVADPETPLP